jgi:hypothetical protein
MPAADRTCRTRRVGGWPAIGRGGRRYGCGKSDRRRRPDVDERQRAALHKRLATKGDNPGKVQFFTDSRRRPSPYARRSGRASEPPLEPGAHAGRRADGAEDRPGCGRRKPTELGCPMIHPHQRESRALGPIWTDSVLRDGMRGRATPVSCWTRTRRSPVGPRYCRSGDTPSRMSATRTSTRSR